MNKKFNRWIRSKTGLATIGGIIIIFITIFLIGQQIGWWQGSGLQGTAGLPATSFPPPPSGYTCFPTCNETDGKFLVISNHGQRSFTDERVVLWITVPADMSTFEIGIFDGDSGKDQNGDINWRGGNWDDTLSEAIYTLYADPLKNGLGMVVVGNWYGNQDGMPNNDWFNITLNNINEAQAPSQHYIYRLEVIQPVGDISGANSFKLRSNGYLSTGKSELVNANIGITGGLANINDLYILHPEFSDIRNLGPSNYTGDWQLYFYIPNDTSTLSLWDGDFDRGNGPLEVLDDDDPNTVGKPEWASVYVVDEREGGVGIPPDDAPNTIYRREPAVKYSFTDPEGMPVYENDNPSGTEEWENFVVSTDPSLAADLYTERIQPGFYTLHIEGLDLHNFVWLRVDYEIVPATCDGPCTPPPVWPEGSCPRTIGYWKNNVKKVLIDNKTNGVQESYETLTWGLNNVALASPLFRSGIDLNAPYEIGDIVPLTAEEANRILLRDKKDYNDADSQSMLARALQQNLATWMNLGTGKIGPTTVVSLSWETGSFQGTVMEALLEAQNIILYGGDLERAKSMADQINNGLLGEDAADSVCTDYVQVIPPEIQPPAYDDMPEAPLPPEPENPVPPPPDDPATCGARVNTYNVENPTNNPFYGIKYEFSSGTEIKDGDYDQFKYTIPYDLAAGMTSVQLEAKASTDVGYLTLEGCDFTSPLPCGEPTQDENHYFAFYFMGALDNGDGTLTLTFQVQNFLGHGLSHATIGMPDGFVPDWPQGNYQSEVCP